MSKLHAVDLGFYADGPVMENGATFGRWTVIDVRPGYGHGRIKVKRSALCRCRCGTERVVDVGTLRRGLSRSCGCLSREITAVVNRVHGQSRDHRLTPEYVAWQHAKRRATDSSLPCWKNYGGRGIGMAEEWLHDFSAFFAHVGPKPDASLTLDRIDNDRGYEPGNVRWADRSTQRRNRRDTARRVA